jgi:hypothetical protein
MAASWPLPVLIAATSAEHGLLVASMRSNRFPGSRVQHLSGFSLIECLVVNALALALLSMLLTTSAEMISAAQKAADRSEQALRARQVFDFLDSLVTAAQMPDTWTAGETTTAREIAQHIPMEPCRGFDTATRQSHWGGFAIVDFAKLPCLPGVETGTGLYFELVRPCPEECGEGSGYQIVSAQCHLRDGLTMEDRQWQVSWQKTMARPHQCLEGAFWGRVERVMLSHRSAEDSIEGVAVLRLQQIAQGTDATYRWLNPETMVLGIDEWQLSNLSRSPDLTGNEVLVETEHRRAVRVNMMVGPHRSQIPLPGLAIERLLLSDRFSARG